MTTSSLEERVTRLEKLVGAFTETKPQSVNDKDWRKTVGLFRDDSIMKEIIDEALRLREVERQKITN